MIETIAGIFASGGTAIWLVCKMFFWMGAYFFAALGPFIAAVIILVVAWRVTMHFVSRSKWELVIIPVMCVTFVFALGFAVNSYQGWAGDLLDKAGTIEPEDM